MIKNDKRLVKVVATIITGSGFIGRGHLKTTLARGISALKRGDTVPGFISKFMGERGVSTYTLHQRGEDTWATSPIMALNQEPKVVITYHFVEFLSQDIGFHAKDLSQSELDRDMKQLKKVIYV
jgi:hypothetical protein